MSKGIPLFIVYLYLGCPSGTVAGSGDLLCTGEARGDIFKGTKGVKDCSSVGVASNKLLGACCGRLEGPLTSEIRRILEKENILEE